MRGEPVFYLTSASQEAISASLSNNAILITAPNCEGRTNKDEKFQKYIQSNVIKLYTNDYNDEL